MESIDKAAAQRVYVRLIEPVRGRIVKNIVIAALSSLCGFVPYFAITRVAQISIVEGVPSLDELAFWVLLAVAGAVAGRILFALATSSCHYADADFRVHVRTVLVEHLGKVPLGWFSDNNSAQVKQAATDDVLNLHQSVGHAPVDVTTALLSPLIPLVYLFTVDARFALLVVVYLAAVIGVAWPFMMKDFGPLNKQYNEALVEVSSASVEMIDGIAVVKTFGSASRAGVRYREATAALAKICYEWTKSTSNPFSLISALFSPATMLVVMAAATLFFCFAGHHSARAVHSVSGAGSGNPFGDSCPVRVGALFAAVGSGCRPPCHCPGRCPACRAGEPAARGRRFAAYRLRGRVVCVRPGLAFCFGGD
ncbi:MAG: hypothetical protein PEGG_00802 [Paraeggerthella hongkongensis]